MTTIDDLDPDRPLVVVRDGVAWYRASGITSCETALLAARLGLPAMAPPLKMKQRYDAGHDLEELVLRKYFVEHNMQSFFERQGRVEIPIGTGAAIAGHYDTGATSADIGPHVVDAKAFAPSTYDVFVAKGIAAFTYYAWQISIYMYGTGLPGRIVALNKVDHSLHVVTFMEPPVALGAIVAKVMKVEALAKLGQSAIPRCVGVRYPCPYYNLEDPKPAKSLASPDAETAEVMAELAGAYVTARDIETEAKKEKADRVGERLRLMLGEPRDVMFAAGEYEVGWVPKSKTVFLEEKFATEHPDIDLSAYNVSQPDGYRIEVRRKRG